MPLTFWDSPITLFAAASVATGATATGNCDLADKQYDKLCVAVRVVFSATVDGDTTVSFYDGANAGAIISSVPFGTVTFTAATSATVQQSTLIDRGHPYLRVVAANADTAEPVNVQILAQGHFEANLNRMA